jgi:hypothetical protein
MTEINNQTFYQKWNREQVTAAMKGYLAGEISIDDCFNAWLPLVSMVFIRQFRVSEEYKEEGMIAAGYAILYDWLHKAKKEGKDPDGDYFNLIYTYVKFAMQVAYAQDRQQIFESDVITMNICHSPNYLSLTENQIFLSELKQLLLIDVPKKFRFSEDSKNRNGAALYILNCLVEGFKVSAIRLKKDFSLDAKDISFLTCYVRYLIREKLWEVRDEAGGIIIESCPDETVFLYEQLDNDDETIDWES